MSGVERKEVDGEMSYRYVVSGGEGRARMLVWGQRMRCLHTLAMNSDGFLVFRTHSKDQSSRQVRPESQYVTYCTQTKTDSIVCSTKDSPSTPSVYI